MQQSIWLGLRVNAMSTRIRRFVTVDAGQSQ